jgi:hypothetical protein
MRLLIIALIVMLSSFPAQSQDVQQRQERYRRYMERAEVRHLNNSVTVTANAPRPLAQTMTALSEEFAWIVDFEDPPYYSKYDLVDDTDPKWRAAHPNARGVTAIAGDGFQTELPENANADTSPVAEEHILDRVVLDYNASGNPGRFSVRNEGDGRFAIVGTHVKDENGRDQSVSSILDTPISVPTDSRDAYKTIEVILNALSTKTQASVIAGAMPINALLLTKVSLGGQNVPARSLLLQTLSVAKIKLYWHLYYDNDVRMYALNVRPLKRANYDASGNRTTVLVR